MDERHGPPALCLQALGGSKSRTTQLRSLEELGMQDRTMRGIEFVRMVKHIGQSRGNLSQAVAMAENTRAPARVVDVLKAAVGAGVPGGG